MPAQLATAVATVERWAATAPELGGDFTADSTAATAYWGRGTELLADLPDRPERTPEQQALARAVHTAGRRLRRGFVHRHGDRLHDELTDGGRALARLPELAYGAAELVPGLTPGRETVAAELTHSQPAKEGWEADQGVLFWGLLRSARSGGRIQRAMLRPTSRAQRLLPGFRRSGTADLGVVTLDRRGTAGHITVRNLSCLNAEDNTLAEDLETAVDLVLLDDDLKVGVVRGAPMTHPRYLDRRVFNAGINLTDLYHGRISLVDFLLRRELGYISKIIHGLDVTDPAEGPDPAVPEVREKPWIAAVDTFAIGGGMQLALAFDHVVADPAAYFSLPAVQEGIIPGAANFRLSRILGPRLARQVILGGRKIHATDPEARLLCDEVVETERIDAAVDAAADWLQAPSVVSNRRMLNLVDEPLGQFREYLARFALEQSERLYAEDVMEILERTWIKRGGRG
ncbi:enoyl-CoA hydratase/isomerase family protein [Kitasatospora sp. NPDC097643]|uniref:enoyl-CoA hydratase/isomerase family protein n=1 Tax=Kitasatospora sp. NPDC097643 TaxID=3157230 RepID=UPI00332C89F0